MISVYLLSFTFGSVLLLASILFGGADKDFDKDLDFEADAEADIDLDAEADGDVEVGSGDGPTAILDGDTEGMGDFIWLPIFSMRFWTFGAASFGFTGTAFHYASFPWIVTLVLAILFGSVVGTAAAYFFRMLKKDSVSGSTSARGYIGEQARVVLPIADGGRGKIMIEGPQGNFEFMATSLDAIGIKRGDTVLIAGFKDGIADVSRLKELKEKEAQPRPAETES